MKILIRLYHRIAAALARRRAAIIRRDLQIHIEQELSRERQHLALADWHQTHTTTQPTKNQ